MGLSTSTWIQGGWAVSMERSPHTESNDVSGYRCTGGQHRQQWAKGRDLLDSRHRATGRGREFSYLGDALSHTRHFGGAARSRQLFQRWSEPAVSQQDRLHQTRRPGIREFSRRFVCFVGIDFIKLDGVTPGSYHDDLSIDNRAEVEAWSKAIAQSGRPIWFTVSWDLDEDYLSTL